MKEEFKYITMLAIARIMSVGDVELNPSSMSSKTVWSSLLLQSLIHVLKSALSDQVYDFEESNKTTNSWANSQKSYFWDHDKIRKFIETCNDIAMANGKLKNKLDNEHIFEGNWLECIHNDIKKRLMKHNKNIDGSKSIQLLNSVRNAVSPM